MAYLMVVQFVATLVGGIWFVGGVAPALKNRRFQCKMSRRLSSDFPLASAYRTILSNPSDLITARSYENDPSYNFSNKSEKGVLIVEGRKNGDLVAVWKYAVQELDVLLGQGKPGAKIGIVSVDVAIEGNGWWEQLYWLVFG
ncbi:hypothetical protein HK096_011318, partial [Nowakowskiella sp. JEL0078]